MIAAVLAAALVLGAPPEPGGFLTGAELRYGHRNVLVRTAADLLAIPAGVAQWEHEDFAEFSLWSGAVLVMMAGQPSYDAQLQAWLHQTLGRPGTRFTLHTPVGDALIWAATGALFGTFELVGFFGNVPPLLELFSLALEAFSVAEISHLTLKLLIGREGPRQGQGLGEVYGPAGGVRLFPDGTPSGHATGMYALLGAVSAYVDRWWVTALLQVFGVAFCASLVIDDYHFASDVLFGGALGWHIGTWVVRHRRSRATSPTFAERLQVVPVASARPLTAGVVAVVAF